MTKYVPALRRKKTTEIPFFFLLSLSSAVYGLVLIRSASQALAGNYMRNQLIALGLGVILYAAAFFFDPDPFLRLWPLAEGMNLAFIGSLCFFGVGESNKSWLRAGSIGIQPAEIGKLVFILCFSAHIEAAKRRGFRFCDIMGLCFHAAVMAGAVIFFSRDDGMSLAFIFIAFFMLYTAGVKGAWFAFGGTVLAAASPFIWTRLMDEYQRSRILAVFHPEQYPDIAYQALRTRNAIGSGQIFGMGYGNGTLTQRNLIPTKHTDSILAVAGEELGAAGCAAVILLLTLLIFFCLRAALRAEETCPRMICSGVAGMLIFQTVLNIGMNLGLLPMIGLTLPFFSYGGTSLATMFAAVGLTAGIDRRHIKRKKNLDVKLEDFYEKGYRCNRI